ncbi:MAG: sulfatase-like hydrolase/transferase [Pseudomonadota bacterium]
MTQPNIILIITDNQPADLLGCYGNDEIHTPHIDALAARGARFMQAYCPNAMCSPCRASILTGHMPSQHGVHTWLDDRLAGTWPAGWNAVEGLPTFTQALKDAGYRTGLVGKYHLGLPQPGQNGIDHWAVMEAGHTTRFEGIPMRVNGEPVDCPGHSVDFFTEEALKFIAAGPEPYALILAYNGPYGHWPSIAGRADNRFAHLYDHTMMQRVPREGICPEAIALYDLQKHLSGPGGPDFSGVLKLPNNLESLRNYYSQMSLVDDGVGRVVAAAGDAVIAFTADHGFSLGHHGYWGHGQATWPSSINRISYSVPLILAGPGISPSVPAGLASNMDLGPTLLDLAGVVPFDSAARSLAGMLAGAPSPHGALFFEQEESRALRTEDWLCVSRFEGSATYPLGHALYDLRADPDCRVNLTGLRDEEARLASELSAAFEEMAHPAYDLWRGGACKSNTSRPWLWRDVWGDGWAPVL